MSGSGYHARGNELARWSDILREAASGQGGVLTVSAGAGIGKTRLLAELGGRATDEGFRILRGVGRRLERSVAHSATLQLFETVSAGDVAGLYEGVAALARPLLQGGHSAADPFAQTHALFWCLANLATQGPVALLVDDAQWLDQASANFLAYAVERASELPVAIAVASRPEAFRREQSLIVIGDRARASCNLAPLNADQVSLILEDLLPAIDPRVAREIATVSGGNALLVHQLALGIADGDPAEAWSATDADGIVHGYVSRRIAELSPTARALLDAAAVLGNGAAWRVGGRVAGLADHLLPEAAQELRDSRLVLDDAVAVAFAHVLVCDAVLEQIPHRLRSQLHRRSADAVGRRHPDIAAAHLLLTEPAEDDRVVQVLLEQARTERLRGATNNAITLLRRAHAEPPSPALETEVALALGEALLVTGAVAEASELLTHAVQKATDGQRTAAARSAARALAFVGDPVGGVRLLEEFSRGTGAEGRLLRAELSGIRQTEHALATQAPTEITSAGFDHRAASAMSAYDHIVVWDGRADDNAAELVGVAADVVSELGFESPLSGMLVMGLVGGGGSGWPAARDLIESARTLARANGSALALAVFSALRSRLSYLEGRLREAQADGELSVDLAARTSPLIQPFAVSTQVMALCAAGQVNEASAVLDRHGFAHGDVPATATAANLLLSRLMLRRAQGRLDEALDDIERIRPFGRGRAPWPSSWTPEIARTFRAAGQTARARELAATHLQQAQDWGAPLHGAEALLLNAEFEPSVESLEHALAVLGTLPAQLTRSQILCALGSAYRRSGRRTLAQQHLLQALELVDICSCPPLMTRIREELAACGLRPRRTTQSGVPALTASELRVARLAASGMTNTDIAQELFVSLKTVENHLTKTYAKLAITSRRELTALTLDTGLADT